LEEKSWEFTIGPIIFDGTILLMCLLTVAIVFSLVFWASRDLKMKPRGKQNVLEFVIDFVSGVIKDNLSARELPKFQLISFTFFTFLLVSNNLGLVTKIVTHAEVSLWKSPTADPLVTLTLAMIALALPHFFGVGRLGFRKYISNSFLQPMPLIAPMKVLEEFTNLLTLGLRLYGNIYAGEVLLGLVCNLGASKPILLPVAVVLEMAWTGFSIFISCIQAYIFVTLMNVYISHKILEEH